jgi:hypothetical protein
MVGAILSENSHFLAKNAENITNKFLLKIFII